MYDEDWHPNDVEDEKWRPEKKIPWSQRPAVDRIPDWTIAVAIVFVTCAMLGAPIWMCWLRTSCTFAQ